MPYRKLALMHVDVKHRVHDIIHLLRMYDAHKRHRRPVGIPEGECGIIGEAVIVMSHAVSSAIASVSVTEYGRGNHGVVERGIEYLHGILVGCLYAYLGKFSVPGLIGSRCHSIKVPVRELGLHVSLGPVHAYR